jgi:hypothetical protein
VVVTGATGKLPSFWLPIIALWDNLVRLILSEVGQSMEIDNARIKKVLVLEFRELAETTAATADSMIRYGVVKAKS